MKYDLISDNLFFTLVILDIKQIDPRVLDYAATKLQAGFR